MVTRLLRKEGLRYLVLICLGLVWATPLVAMLLFSFAPDSDILLMKLFPSSFSLESYQQVVTSSIRGVSVPRSMLNSAIVMIIQVLGILVLDAPAAYALARVKFWGREIIFGIILVTLMMPGLLNLISLYDLMAKFSLVDTLAGVLLPGLPRVVGIFLLRQFFRAVPHELEDAARIDGASEWQIFVRIMIPMAAPALSTLAIITALYSWNNFLWPLVIINTPESMTAPIAISYLSAGTYASQNYAALLAAAFTTALPMILLFFFGQKWILRGLMPTSGIK